jgi:hypothetical protein
MSSSVRIIGVPVQIRTRYLQNTSQRSTWFIGLSQQFIPGGEQKLVHPEHETNSIQRQKRAHTSYCGIHKKQVHDDAEALYPSMECGSWFEKHSNLMFISWPISSLFFPRNYLSASISFILFFFNVPLISY